MGTSDLMITSEALENFMGWVRDATEYRAILTDLLSELAGDDGDGHAITADGDDACRVCQMIDRAEARLRKVDGGDE